MAIKPLCSIPDCGKREMARGWCSAHYTRWRSHGDPLICLRPKTPTGEPLRYFREVVLTYEGDECLPWPFGRTKGRGTMWIEGRLQYVARLVCEKVNGPAPSPAHEAAHSCGKGTKGCVTKRHLLWKTRTENEADKLLHGTAQRGEKSNLAKLTESDVIRIRELEGAVSREDLSTRFNVSVSNIRAIVERTNWAWLEG